MTTVAIAAIVRNEADYLPDWVIFHLWQGVSRFHITVDETQGPCDDDTVAVLKSLAPLGIEIRILRNDKSPDRQVNAYNYARGALMDFDWVAYLDPDEYLFDPKGRSLPVVLDAMRPDTYSVAVQQRVFGSNGRLDKPKLSVRQAYTKRATVQCPEHKWFKTVARPTAKMLSAHGSNKGLYVLGDGDFFTPETHGSASRIATEGLRIHHYMLKSREEFLRKRARGAISDRGDYRRFTMDYFTERDKYANAVEDLTLAEWFPK
jgi:hypothetical protein